MSNLGPSVGVYNRCLLGLLRSEPRALDRAGFSLQNHSSELPRRDQRFLLVLGAEPYFEHSPPGCPQTSLLKRAGGTRWGIRVLAAVAPPVRVSVARLAGSTPRGRPLPKRVPEEPGPLMSRQSRSAMWPGCRGCADVVPDRSGGASLAKFWAATTTCEVGEMGGGSLFDLQVKGGFYQ